MILDGYVQSSSIYGVSKVAGLKNLLGNNNDYTVKTNTNL
jgi:hypothetical protein